MITYNSCSGILLTQALITQIHYLILDNTSTDNTNKLDECCLGRRATVVCPDECCLDRWTIVLMNVVWTVGRLLHCPDECCLGCRATVVCPDECCLGRRATVVCPDECCLGRRATVVCPDECCLDRWTIVALS